MFPFWYSKSNFVSLLNLTKQIEIYGPVRLHWEGLKENFIQKVKPLLNNKRTRVSYLVTKLQKMYRQNNLNVIIDKYVPDLSTSTYERISTFQRFKSLNNLIGSLENFESVKIFNNITFSCIFIYHFLLFYFFQIFKIISFYRLSFLFRAIGDSCTI